MSADFVDIPFIEFRDVQKYYQNGLIKALDGVSFTIPKGKIMGYIGPNGAGKTTTIKSLVGLIQDYQGHILINGLDSLKKHCEVQKLIGYLPQDVGFQEWRTVEQLLRTFGELSGMDSLQIEKRIDEVLEIVGLPDVRNRKIIHLSGGMKQKLLFAQALLHEPEVLILDEPMTGLDPTSRYQIRNIIKRLAKSNITIFFSSHILSDVQGIADIISIINQGKIMKIGTPEELQSEFKVGNEIELIFTNSISAEISNSIIEGVKSISLIEPNRILFHLPAESDIDITIKNIIQFVQSKQLHLRNLNVLKPSLEEVYLKYVTTGGDK